jgi:ABC-type phosphate transport system substrate-binding protein
VTSVVSSWTRMSIFVQVLLALGMSLVAQAVRAQTIVVIVNPSIGVQHLTRREALDIFLGRYRTFPSGASALPIDLDINSTERTQFYLILAHKDSSDMSSYWARLTFSGKISPPFAVADARMAVDIVANNPNAIAYVDRSAVDNRVRIALEVTP